MRCPPDPGFSLIVATDEHGGIAKDGKIPWRVPADLKHFRETTLDSTVIMGRKTWDSLPKRFRPLPGRNNIVISRTPQDFPGATPATSLPQALDIAFFDFDAPIFVIGGKSIYELALHHPLLSQIYHSVIPGNHECDLSLGMMPALMPDSPTEPLHYEGFDLYVYEPKQPKAHPLVAQNIKGVLDAQWLRNWFTKYCRLGDVRDYTYPSFDGSIHKASPLYNCEKTGFAPHLSLRFPTQDDALSFVCAHGGIEPGYYFIQNWGLLPSLKMLEEQD